MHFLILHLHCIHNKYIKLISETAAIVLIQIILSRRDCLILHEKSFLSNENERNRDIIGKLDKIH